MKNFRNNWDFEENMQICASTIYFETPKANKIQSACMFLGDYQIVRRNLALKPFQMFFFLKCFLKYDKSGKSSASEAIDNFCYMIGRALNVRSIPQDSQNVWWDGALKERQNPETQNNFCSLVFSSEILRLLQKDVQKYYRFLHLKQDMFCSKKVHINWMGMW